MSTKLKQGHRRHNSVGYVAPKGTVSSVAIPIAETPYYIERLKSLMHSEEVLVAAGYIMEELPGEALEMKKRCSGCGKRMLLSNPPVTFFKLTFNSSNVTICAQKQEETNSHSRELGTCSKRFFIPRRYHEW
jgi:hypothetical protein